MSDHVPTTAAIRSVYAAWVSHLRANNATDADGFTEFDRWLAQHDAEVRAKALREAVTDRGFRVSRRCRRALLNRADRIEAGDPR